MPGRAPHACAHAIEQHTVHITGSASQMTGGGLPTAHGIPCGIPHILAAHVGRAPGLHPAAGVCWHGLQTCMGLHPVHLAACRLIIAHAHQRVGSARLSDVDVSCGRIGHCIVHVNPAGRAALILCIITSWLRALLCTRARSWQRPACMQQHGKPFMRCSTQCSNEVAKCLHTGRRAWSRCRLRHASAAAQHEAASPDEGVAMASHHTVQCVRIMRKIWADVELSEA